MSFSSPSSDSEIISRTFNIYKFDPHPKRKILIIHGEVLVTISSPLCPEVLAEETREFKKLVTLEGLTKESNRDLVLDSVYQECPYLNPELRLHLAVVVDFLRNRQYDENGVVITPNHSSSQSHSQSQSAPTTPTEFPDFEVEKASPKGFLAEAEEEFDLNEKVDITQLDRYVDLLYEEDFMDKIKGARSLAKLSKHSENLALLASHETALNALFRTLREEYRKSLDLSTQVMSVCQSLAQYRDFHPILHSNKIFSLALDIAEYELQRYERWRLEVARRQDIVENRSEFPGSAGSYQKAKADFDKLKVKFAEVTRKQDHILALSFDVILLLSENQFLQLEALSRGVVPMLMDTLPRKNVDLLKIALIFLKNLSVFLPSKAQMGQDYVVEKIAQLLDANIPADLIKACLDLLLNLCFDTKLRHKMVILGLLPKLAFFLEDASLENVTRRILYVMSMDRKVRPRFANIPQVLPHLTKSLAENREEPGRNSLEVAGILVNLALNKKCALALCEKGRSEEESGLLPLLQQAFESEDEIVMKIVRNLSDHQTLKEGFAPFICDLARAISDASSQDFVLECIGTLANLDLPNVDFCKLLQEFNLLPWIHSVLEKYLGQTETESLVQIHKGQEGPSHSLLTLEVVLLTGTACSDGECADLLVEEGILDLLIKILITTSDLDLKAQVLYVFYKMCFHSGSRQHIQEGTQIPKIILELLQHEDPGVQQLCEGIMTQFGETDASWMSRLREKRFRFFNEAWIEMTERSTFDEDEDPYGAFSFGVGNTKERLLIEMQSSASETLITEDESGEDQSDLEVDREEGSGEPGRGSVGERKGSIFERFKAQYEQEMRAKEIRKEESDEEDHVGGERIARKERAKSARRVRT